MGKIKVSTIVGILLFIGIVLLGIYSKKLEFRKIADTVEHRGNTIVHQDSIIHAYDEYYHSVERLLDSLGVHEDHPVFKTAIGLRYLDDKACLDSINNK